MDPYYTSQIGRLFLWVGTRKATACLTQPPRRAKLQEVTSRQEKPLWQCPLCGNLFVTRNMRHSCGRFRLSDHFEGKDAVVREMFDLYLSEFRRFGPVRVIPQKTRIVFQVCVRFAGVVTRKRWLEASFWLTRRVESPIFHRIEFIPPHYHLYSFRLRTASHIDDRLRELLKEAYANGCQESLG
jgi:hypothetical protein